MPKDGGEIDQKNIVYDDAVNDDENDDLDDKDALHLNDGLANNNNNNNNIKPGPSKVRAEHLKEWVEEAYRDVRPYQGNWNRVVDLIQTCFWERQVPT